jgi:hypothetical protein
MSLLGITLLGANAANTDKVNFQSMSIDSPL